MKLNRHILTIIILGLAVWLIIPKLVGADEVFRVVSTASVIYLSLAFFLQVVSWSSDALINRTLLFTLAQKLRFFDLVRISSLEVFASHCLPVAGIGFSVSNIYFFKKQGLSSQSAILLVVIRNLFVNLGFAVLFLLSLAAVPTHPSLALTGVISAVVVTLVGLLSLSASLYFYFNKAVLFRAVAWGANLMNRLCAAVIHRQFCDMNKVRLGVEDIYASLEQTKKRKMFLPIAFLAAIMYHLAGVGCLYFVFLSLGYSPPWGALLLGYFLPMFSVMVTPGGLGLFEGLMSAIYLLYQFPRSETLMAVLIYRFLSFWLPIPLGFLSYLSLHYGHKPIKTQGG
ncbi:MAG: flippase-like domain-containing protein [Chloroflexi bacterium]|nr:flippase-like domain-containing protein [Chloroflexota bacterium]